MNKKFKDEQEDFGSYFLNFLNENAWVEIDRDEWEANKNDKDYAFVVDKKTKQSKFFKRGGRF